MLIILASTWAGSQANQVPGATVGVPGRISELVLPAPPLEVKPLTREQALVVRILAVRPHGDAFRYDFEFTGLEAGEYDLRTALQPIPGASPAAVELPPIPVVIQSLLAPGQVLPNHPEQHKLEAFGGYRVALGLAALLWFLGLFLILRKRRQEGVERRKAEAPPLSLAEQLKPLVERAMRGELKRGERAGLELLLLAFWRRKLGLDKEAPALVLSRMRDHAEAGPLLLSLERWLHAPPTQSAVDLPSLLAPYRNMPAEVLPNSPALGEGH